MTYDIIDISQEEAEKLTTVQLKLLRTAQQKKNELTVKLDNELEEYTILTLTNGSYLSSLNEEYAKKARAEYERQVEVLREQLIFNMSLGEPTVDGDTGDDGNDDSGYIVDYELTYLERYIQVRDYYLSIADPAERLALLRADEVAQKYLGQTYYNYLYDYLSQFLNQ